MTLHIGTRLGPYEILGALGTGGMGEVYHTRDTKLDRDVAVKILPDSFAHDPERVARFTREAKTLAALNHPHIAQIYGLEESNGLGALVMELVEGPTLADRIASGPMPMDEALPIAKQIAEALEAAHEQGIIHRDLKPANIKVREDGTVKVLDFGLAKALDPLVGTGVEGAALTNSPTITSPAAMTQRGVILGTAAYMAPGQARGRAVDKRADIWAFGCVFFEVLTGRRAFSGDDVSETLAHVLMKDPEWPALPADTPPPIRTLLRRCLEKDRKRRLDSMADARLEIDDALAGPTEQPTGSAASGRALRRERVVWMAAVVLSLAVAAALGREAYLSRTSAPAVPPETRLEISTPGGSLAYLALSPDARSLVYQATVDGQTQLWLRPFDSEAARPLPGTNGATLPFWSPDSRAVAFFADQQLKRIDVAGGPVQVLASAPFGRGGSWSREGVILFSPTTVSPLYRVPASGGAAVEATRLKEPGERGHLYPSFLPDGRHYLFFARGTTAESQGVYIGTIDSPDGRRLLDADSAAMFSPPDRVLFARQGALMAQRLDLAGLNLVGDPWAVAARVVRDFGNAGSSPALSASSVGPVAYRASAGERQLVWLDRSGRQIGTLGSPDAAQPVGIRLSPDGRTVALSRDVAGNLDVWLLDTGRGILRRFTTDPSEDFGPIWSAGGRVAFISNRQGIQDVYEKPAVREEGETLLLASSENKNTRDWSPDGRFILYSIQSTRTSGDLWALPLDGDRRSVPVAQTPFTENLGRFSPDSRWIAHQSNESGRAEIYVKAFPGLGGKTQVSTAGGTNPEWGRDGKELFYFGNDRLMAAPVTLGDSAVRVGTPVALFPLAAGTPFTVSPDGQRFLVAVATKEPSPITILMNWGASK